MFALPGKAKRIRPSHKHVLQEFCDPCTSMIEAHLCNVNGREPGWLEEKHWGGSCIANRRKVSRLRASRHAIAELGTIYFASSYANAVLVPAFFESEIARKATDMDG